MRCNSTFLKQCSILVRITKVSLHFKKYAFFVSCLSALVFSNLALSQISLDELIEEEAILSQELIDKTERLGDINQQISQIQLKIKRVDSRLLPLQIEMKKLKLEFKKIDVKKADNRKQSEITQLSRIKYRRHILSLKIKVEEQTRSKLEGKITTLNDREGRLQIVVKKLSRKLFGTQNAISNFEEYDKGGATVKKSAPAFTPAVKAVTKTTQAPTPSKASKKPVVVKSQAAYTKQQVKKTSVTKNTPLSKATDKAIAQKNSPTATIAKTSKPLPQLFEHKSTKLTAEQLEKRRQSIDLLLTMDNIPESTKAVIKAKHRALENLEATPYLGDKPQIELRYLKQDETKQVVNLKHLGNNQYINTLTIASGFQQFHIGELKFTKRIDKVFHGKKAIIIIDAIDVNNPTFEVYPVTLEKIDYFSY